MAKTSNTIGKSTKFGFSLLGRRTQLSAALQRELGSKIKQNTDYHEKRTLSSLDCPRLLANPSRESCCRDVMRTACTAELRCFPFSSRCSPAKTAVEHKMQQRDDAVAFSLISWLLKVQLHKLVGNLF